MFQISPDQTQWFHLYRVQKVHPITFVLFTCLEVNEQGNPARYLDLRIVSSEQEIMGGSWCIKSDPHFAKQVTRADCAKFLELYAKFTLANAIRRGIDEIELIESSREELSLAAALDEVLHRKLESVGPTLIAKLARNLMSDLRISQAGLEIAEMPDWPTRDANAA